MKTSERDELKIDELKYGLPWLPLSLKMLFTGYLLAIGFGLLMAGVQIMLTHGMADGKFGLSVDDIVYSYYGNRTGTTLESMLNGSMKDKAPPAVRMELIKWAREGAPLKDWNNGIRKKVNTYCVACHNEASSLPAFTKLEILQELAKADTGQSIARLTALSHIHLFGISFIFMLMGLIFVFSIGIPQWIKGTLVMIPFAFLILDIISWWLTKYIPGFALITIIGGVGYSLASSAMLFTSLYQMWLLPWLLTGDGTTHEVAVKQVNRVKDKLMGTDCSLVKIKVINLTKAFSGYIHNQMYIIKRRFNAPK